MFGTECSTRLLYKPFPCHQYYKICKSHLPRDIATVIKMNAYSRHISQDHKTKQKTLWQIGLSFWYHLCRYNCICDSKTVTVRIFLSLFVLVSFTIFKIQFFQSQSEQCIEKDLPGSAGYIHRMHKSAASSSSWSRGPCRRSKPKCL